MGTELAFWDKISLALVILVVLVFIVRRIMQVFNSPPGCSGGCNGCSYVADNQCPNNEDQD